MPQISRREAAELGERKYQGKTCKRGHDGLRYTANGLCVQCARESTQRAREQIRQLLQAAK